MADWTTASTTVDAVANALNAFDWARAMALCETLAGELRAAREPFPKKESVRLLRALRRKRKFGEINLMAQALMDGGRNEAAVRTAHAQALVDQGQLMPAQLIGRAVLSEAGLTANERAEALGLLGRVDKQHYVNARRPDDPRQQEHLRQALASYGTVYPADPTRVWHGINIVALLARAERDGVDVGGQRADFRVIARTILDHLAKIEADRGDLEYWDRATSMEAHIALGEFDQALLDLRDYVTDAQTDAFECTSTLRQLREVWQIDETSGPGALLIAGLQSAILRRTGGEVELRKSDVQQGLQRNFTGVPDLPLEWWKNGLARCAAVARIEDLNGRRVGTGFLVRREDFLGEAGPPVLMTNWHVVSEGGTFPNSLSPAHARANFEACDRIYPIGKEMLAYSSKLDVSLLSLDNFDDRPGFCPIEPPPARFTAEQKSRLYVIGYPGGRGLSFSLHDSEWLDSDGTLVHYRTPTEPGSSGSPVFDEKYWSLIALHHRGLDDMQRLRGQEGKYQANEGISVTAIQEALRAARKS